ncbi:hypothetical protein ABI59_23055 [Acidobacteria bacterium Mor1]|nr:hypothetical protein ABI59_23055 [Acidobacteria bacterium Mor1]
MLEDLVILRSGAFVLGGALFWVLYWDMKDRMKPEPRLLLLAAFALGLGSALLALGGFAAAARLGAPSYPSGGTVSILAYCLLLVGPLEEGAKFLVARLFVYRWHAFDEPVDGLVYASAIGIGFAALENLLFLPYLPWSEGLARSIASPLTHSLFAAVWGFGLSRARLRTATAAGRAMWMVLPLAASMLLHGLYDFALLAAEATWAASAITLAIWLPVIAYARRLVGRDLSANWRRHPARART